MIETNFDRFAIPEQGYRRCLAILNLQRQYDRHALEQACKTALNKQGLSSPAERKILRQTADQAQATLEHDNLRGVAYYASDST